MRTNVKFNLQRRKLIKEYLQRLRFQSIEIDYFFLKILTKNKIISKQSRALAVFYLSFLCSTITKTKQKNVCLRSGYRRSVINKFGLNRCFARNEIGENFFPGFSPAKR